MVIEHNLIVDVQKPLTLQNLRDTLVAGDKNANQFNISIVKDGKPFAVAGNVHAYFNAADGSTTHITGALVGSVASVVLPADCYTVTGYAQLLVDVVQGDSITTVAALNMHVISGACDNVHDASDFIPSLQELVQQIDNLRQATADAERVAGPVLQEIEDIKEWSSNLLDVAARTENKSISTQAPYMIVDNNTYDVSAPIRCESTEYTVYGAYRVGFYDGNGDGLGVTPNITSGESYTFTPLGGAKTMVVVLYRKWLNNAQLNAGSTLLPYEPYYVRAKGMGEVNERIDELTGDLIYFDYSLMQKISIEKEEKKAAPYPDHVLTESGGTVVRTGYHIDRYVVTAGNVYHIRTNGDVDYSYQFNAGTSPKPENLIGKVAEGAVDVYAVCPKGATYLLVSQADDNTENVISQCVYKTDDIQKHTEPIADDLTDFDNAPVNAVANINGYLQNIANKPADVDENSGVLLTWNGDNAREASSNKSFTTQVLVTRNNNLYHRICIGGTWRDWVNTKQELPFVENLVEFSAFGTFGIIGDSMSVGAYRESDGTTVHSRATGKSWGGYVQKHCFNNALWFGFSGATTRTFISRGDVQATDESGRADRIGLGAVLRDDKQCDAYIIGLGYNDGGGAVPIGSASDIKQNYADNADTYYGNLDRIIRSINDKYPKSHIFVLTNPRMNKSDTNEYNTAVKRICARYTPQETESTKIHCVDLFALYNQIYESWNDFMWQNHYTAPIYYRMGQLVGTALSNYMREHPITFRFINER